MKTIHTDKNNLGHEYQLSNLETSSRSHITELEIQYPGLKIYFSHFTYSDFLTCCTTFSIQPFVDCCLHV